MDKSLPTKPVSASSTTQNPTLEYLKEHNLPLTRDNYLYVEFMGKPPQNPDAEVEASIPWEIKRQDRQPQSQPQK